MTSGDRLGMTCRDRRARKRRPALCGAPDGRGHLRRANVFGFRAASARSLLDRADFAQLVQHVGHMLLRRGALDLVLLKQRVHDLRRRGLLLQALDDERRRLIEASDTATVFSCLPCGKQIFIITELCR